jgi:hypothetical protein
MLKTAFADRRIFYLPHTLNLEGELSPLQDLRFRRTRTQNLLSYYRTPDIARVYEFLRKWALEGDLISGGHIDFPSIRDNAGRKAKMITLFRDPVARCRSEYEYCRERFLRKSQMSRLDSTIKHKAAARLDFDSYLDFLLDHPAAYGNLAARYVGWDGKENLETLFARDVFHSGVLEESARFAQGLSEKMAVPIAFPHDNRTETSRGAGTTASQRLRIERLYPRDFTLYAWQRDHLGERPRPVRRPVNADAYAQALGFFGLVA